MKCSFIRKNLPLYAGNDLNFVYARVITIHLARCKSCRKEYEAIQRTRDWAVHELQKETYTVSDSDLWQDLVYRLPREAPGYSVKRKRFRAETRKKLAACLAVFTGLAVVIFSLLQHATDSQNIKSGRAVPVIASIEDPDVTVMTFATDDPSVTIVWFVK